MHERFSDRARHAMALANLEAGKLGHDFLAPAHLMLGLISEGKSVATQTLRLLNVDLGEVRDAVRGRLEAGNSLGAMGRRAHTKAMKEVISLAIQEARKFDHRYVGTEHLILGLCAHPDSIPSQVLRERGLDVETLREKTLSLLSGELDAGHDLAHSRHGNFEWIHQQELAKAFHSPKFWHTMILAVDSANRLGASEIEPQHLLMALLRDESNPLAKLLADKGVTPDWLSEQFATSDES